MRSLGWMRGRNPRERRAIAFQIMMLGLILQVGAFSVLLEGGWFVGVGVLMIGLVLAIVGFREARR